MVRSRAVSGLGFLGARVSASANASPALDALVHDSSSTVAVGVVEAREDIEIARLVRQLVSRS
jgi:acetate kinase